MLLCRLLAGGRRGIEDRFQGPQVAVAHDLVEPLFGSDEGQRYPAQDHLAVLRVGNTVSLDAHSGVRALDDAGGGQTAMQRRRRSSRLMVKHSSRPSSRLAAGPPIRFRRRQFVTQQLA